MNYRAAALGVLGLWLTGAATTDAGIQSYSVPAPPAPTSEANATAETADDSTDDLQDTSPAVPQLRTRQISGAQPANPDGMEKRPLLVEGYRQKEYVYGELLVEAGGVLEGFIYDTEGRKIYVYAERADGGVIRAYDRKGKLYTLRAVE